MLSAGIWQPWSLGEALAVAFIRKASGSLLVSFNSLFGTNPIFGMNLLESQWLVPSRKMNHL